MTLFYEERLALNKGLICIINNKIKKMKYLKRFWNWLLGKTTIDERIEAKVDEVVEEVKERVDRIKEEIADVKEAASEVASQAKDVVDAAKGKKRRGRPKKK
jgi:gas vesicle protein